MGELTCWAWPHHWRSPGWTASPSWLATGEECPKRPAINYRNFTNCMVRFPQLMNWPILITCKSSLFTQTETEAPVSRHDFHCVFVTVRMRMVTSPQRNSGRHSARMAKLGFQRNNPPPLTGFRSALQFSATRFQLCNPHDLPCQTSVKLCM